MNQRIERQAGVPSVMGRTSLAARLADSPRRTIQGRSGEADSVGPPYATVLVASRKSLHSGAADFVTDGTHDEIEIQQAINALPGWRSLGEAPVAGGTVRLLGSLFACTALNIAVPAMVLRGSGMWLTTLSVQQLVIDEASVASLIIEDMTVEIATSTRLATTREVELRNVRLVTRTPGATVTIDTPYYSLTDCIVEFATTARLVLPQTGKYTMGIVRRLVER